MMRERTRLGTSLAEINDLESGLADNLELLELAEAENDTGVAEEAETAFPCARKSKP